MIQTLPDGWDPDRLAAFNELVAACLTFMVYDNALGKLGIQDPILLGFRADVGGLIKNVLAPRLRAS